MAQVNVKDTARALIQLADARDVQDRMKEIVERMEHAIERLHPHDEQQQGGGDMLA